VTGFLEGELLPPPLSPPPPPQKKNTTPPPPPPPPPPPFFFFPGRIGNRYKEVVINQIGPFPPLSLPFFFFFLFLAGETGELENEKTGWLRAGHSATLFSFPFSSPSIEKRACRVFGAFLFFFLLTLVGPIVSPPFFLFLSLLLF